MTAALKFPPSAARALTVQDVIDWYQVNTEPGCAEAHAERRRVWGIFCGVFGERPWQECRGHELLTFIRLQKGLKSPWSRKRWVTTIRTPFNVAASLGLIEWNPFSGLKMPSGKDGRDWTEEEFRQLLRISPAYFRRVLVFLRFSGARPGEMRAACWENLNADGSAIVLRSHKTSWATAAPRTIRLNRVCLKLLVWLLSRQADGERTIFLNSHGQPWTSRALDKRLLYLRRKVGISEEVKLHGGRHTFGTRLVMNGQDIATVAKLMGHKTIVSTQRYIHLGDKDEHLQRAVECAVGNRKD